MKIPKHYNNIKHGLAARPTFGINRGALALLALASAGGVHAGVITQTVNFNFAGTNTQNFSFNKFDTSLGNLTSIALAWTANSAITTASVRNNLGDSVTLYGIDFYNTFTASVEGTRLINRANDSVSKSYIPAIVLGENQSHTENNINFTQISRTDTFVPGDTMFASLTGSTPATLALRSTFLVSPDLTSSGEETSTTISSASSNYGSLMVTYTYDEAPIAAVPEPSDILLCAAPVFLFGAGYVRRVKKSRGSQD